MRRETRSVGQNREVVTELCIGDALIDGFFPQAPRGRGIAFVQRDRTECGGAIGGIGQGIELRFGAIELTCRQQNLGQDEPRNGGWNVGNFHVDRRRDHGWKLDDGELSLINPLVQIACDRVSVQIGRCRNLLESEGVLRR